MPYDRLLRHRRSEPGASYQLTICTLDRIPLLTRPDAAEAVVVAITEQATLGHCLNHAWVLMPDHVHWLLTLTNSRPLAQVVAAAKANSSRALQRRKLVTKTAWQPKYFEHRIRNEADIRTQARYLIANPLRAGLVARLRDYPWWYAEWANEPHGPMGAESQDEDLLWD